MQINNIPQDLQQSPLTGKQWKFMGDKIIHHV